MHTKWVIESDDKGAILVVIRSCGHKDRLSYESKRIAALAADFQANERCEECQKRIDQKQMGVWMNS